MRHLLAAQREFEWRNFRVFAMWPRISRHLHFALAGEGEDEICGSYRKDKIFIDLFTRPTLAHCAVKRYWPTMKGMSNRRSIKHVQSNARKILTCCITPCMDKHGALILRIYWNILEIFLFGRWGLIFAF